MPEIAQLDSESITWKVTTCDNHQCVEDNGGQLSTSMNISGRESMSGMVCSLYVNTLLMFVSLEWGTSGTGHGPEGTPKSAAGSPIPREGAQGEPKRAALCLKLHDATNTLMLPTTQQWKAHHPCPPLA